MREEGNVEVSNTSCRPEWDEYFLQLVQMVGTRATCNRGKSGCVIVRDKRVLATGYVGAPSKLPHCDDAGHLMKKVIDDSGEIKQHCVRSVHAEQNALCQAARYGIALEGSTLYCTMEPCRVCAMLIISSGIAKVVCRRRYHAAQESRDMFKEAGVLLEVKEDVVQEYSNQR